MKTDDAIILYAVRYAMGRMSTAPSDVVDYLIARWGSLSETLRRVIQRDVERELERDDEHRRDYPDERQSARPLGWDCDRYTWEQLRALWAESNSNDGGGCTPTRVAP